MNVYFIWAVMTEEELYNGNCFGQYDRFKNTKQADNGKRATLWGFTNKSKIVEKFLAERPVENRYLIQKDDMISKSGYEEMLVKGFTNELIPIALDTRYNIGDKSGYFLPDDTSRIRKDVPEDLKEFFKYRIMTINEYSYITSNVGEICNEYKNRLFKLFDLPITSDIFAPEIKGVLDHMGYNLDALTYHKNAISYMEAYPESKQIFIHDCGPTKSLRYYNHAIKSDLFSVFNLFYITYPELIYYKGDYEYE